MNEDELRNLYSRVAAEREARVAEARANYSEDVAAAERAFAQALSTEVVEALTQTTKGE